MHKVISKQVLNSGVKQVDVSAGHIAAHYRPGQYIVVMPRDPADRIIFTAFDVDVRRGQVSLFFKDGQPEYEDLDELRIGQELFAVAGPFGAS